MIGKFNLIGINLKQKSERNSIDFDQSNHDLIKKKNSLRENNFFPNISIHSNVLLLFLFLPIAWIRPSNFLKFKVVHKQVRMKIRMSRMKIRMPRKRPRILKKSLNKLLKPKKKLNQCHCLVK